MDPAGRGAEAGARAAEFFVTLMAFGEVADNARKTMQGAGFVFKRHGDGIRPEAGSILAGLPAFGANVAAGGGAC